MIDQLMLMHWLDVVQPIVKMFVLLATMMLFELDLYFCAEFVWFVVMLVTSLYVSLGHFVANLSAQIKEKKGNKNNNSFFFG